jgi:hypothetical protein
MAGVCKQILIVLKETSKLFLSLEVFLLNIEPLA